VAVELSAPSVRQGRRETRSHRIAAVNRKGDRSVKRRKPARKVVGGFLGIVLICIAVAGCGTRPDRQPLVWETIQESARRGDLADVKRHLARGEAVSSKGSIGWTPLHLAAVNGHKDVVEFLIAKGADMNARITVGMNTGCTPLHKAASAGQKDIVEILIANGADVNAVANDGETPLHEAATWGHKDVVELLVVKGADLKSRNNYGTTPLRKAAMFGQKEIAELLRGFGAKE